MNRRDFMKTTGIATISSGAMATSGAAHRFDDHDEASSRSDEQDYAYYTNVRSW